MPLFACVRCKTIDNTAHGNYWWNAHREHQEPLCTACDPEIGKWTEDYPRTSLAEYRKRSPDDEVLHEFRVEPKHRKDIEFGISERATWIEEFIVAGNVERVRILAQDQARLGNILLRDNEERKVK